MSSQARFQGCWRVSGAVMSGKLQKIVVPFLLIPFLATSFFGTSLHVLLDPTSRCCLPGEGDLKPRCPPSIQSTAVDRPSASSGHCCGHCRVIPALKDVAGIASPAENIRSAACDVQFSHRPPQHSPEECVLCRLLATKIVTPESAEAPSTLEQVRFFVADTESQWMRGVVFRPFGARAPPAGPSSLA